MSRGIKISELPETTTMANDDPIAIVDVSEDITKKITKSNLLAGITISASNVLVDVCDSPTYTTAQDWMDTTQSSGIIDGGGFTDNGDGSIAVAEGHGVIREVNSDIAPACFFDWAENAAVSLVDQTTNYIFVDYNAGAPIVGSESTKTANNRTKILLGKVFRNGTDLHFVEAGMVISEATKRTLTYVTSMFGEVARASGYEISEVGERYLKSEDGVLFAGLTRLTTSSIDTSGADTYEAYYYDGAAWVSTDLSQIDNLQYNNIASGLVTLTANRYGVHWVYGDPDGHLMSVYGQGDYTLANAEAAPPPSSLPNHIAEFGFLAAKIIVQKSATNLYSVSSAYDTQFTASGAVVHNETTGKSGDGPEYYHLNATQYGGLTQSASTALHTHSHSLLGGVGTNTHTVIDTHLANGAKHFLEGDIDHVNILSIGTNTHAQIDTAITASTNHIASTANPHSVDISDVTPLTTRGDIMIRNATVSTRLAVGAAGFVLTSDGTDVSWAANPAGFADPMTTRGDIIYRNAANTTTRLAAGAANFVLTSDGTDISWAAAGGGGGFDPDTDAFNIGSDAVSSGSSSIALGHDSSATGTSSIAVGYASSATGTSSIAIGYVTNVTGATGGIGIGYNCDEDKGYGVNIGYAVTKPTGIQAVQIGCFGGGSGAQSISIGYNCKATSNSGISIGTNGNASGAYSFTFGYGGTASQTAAYAMGHAASCTGSYSVAFGANANCSGGNSVAFGRTAVASGSNSIAFGYNTDATSSTSIAFGLNAQATTSADAVAFGNAANATHTASMCFGKNSATTENNQIVLGSTSYDSVRVFGALVMEERAASIADVTGFGQIWPHTDGTLRYTEDDGTEYYIDLTAV